MNGDFTGLVERRAITDKLKELAGGRVYRTSAPASEQLERYPDGAIKPYIVLRVSPPIMKATGRNVAATEQEQPHVLTGMVIAVATDDETSEELAADAMCLTIGEQFSDNSTPLQARGGNAWSTVETDSHPERYHNAYYWRCVINL